MTNGFDLHNKILNSKGMKLINRKYKHSFSFNIFNMNLKELRDALTIIENPKVGIELFNIKNREKGNQAYREINRLFHNYLASCKTLIDHTRIFVNSYYKNTLIQQVYDEKIKQEFSEDELSKFIQDLRNYILHKGLPDSKMTLSFKTGEDFQSDISLERDKLLEWDKWTLKSKNFLKNQDKKVRLLLIVNNYSDKIIKFHEWLNLEIDKYHEKDIIEFKQLQNEFKEKYGKIFEMNENKTL